MKKMTSSGVLVFLSFSFLLAVPFRSYAGDAADQVKQSVDAVLEVLKNKELKKTDREPQRRAAIRKIVGERFDFEEMAKRSLAQHWKKRTPAEQKQFISLYTDLLESAYIRKIEKYEDEKVVYGEEKTEGTYSSVKTNILTSKEVSIPIEYRLVKQGSEWKVYDVVIEGVSLVNNYRNQFNSILRSGTYEDLVKKLKERTLKEPV